MDSHRGKKADEMKRALLAWRVLQHQRSMFTADIAAVALVLTTCLAFVAWYHLRIRLQREAA